MTRKPGKKCLRLLSTRNQTRPQGLFIVYTGSGKGKTTAALGLALRAISRLNPVLLIQFLKGTWKSGELSVLDKYKLPVEVHTFGAGFTWKAKCSENARQVKNGLALAARKLKSGKYPLVILDEINYAVDYGFVSVREVLKILRAKAPHVHVVLTGRNVHPKLVNMADLVTDMREVKHPFRDRGLLAQPGLDF